MPIPLSPLNKADLSKAFYVLGNTEFLYDAILTGFNFYAKNKKDITIVVHNTD
jgi:hypothetical protein